MATILDTSGQAANDEERKAIAFLRDHLPKDWLILHNFEMRQREEVFEIDLALLGPHALYLVDIKGTQGNIDVYGSKWYPQGRQPFFSPLAKLRSHAKTLAGIIQSSNTGLTELRKVHVHATVLLTSDNADLYDPANIDRPDVTDVKHCLGYFTDTRRIPANRLNAISRFHAPILKAITGNAKAKNAALVFRDWQVFEKLGGTDRYTEYRAHRFNSGKNAGTVRVRVYPLDPYLLEEERKQQYLLISNAYRAVSNLPAHQAILNVKEFIEYESQARLVIVTDDIAGQSLRLLINKPSLALTFDAKLQVMRDVLSALEHAHRYQVIHRNLNPDVILVTRTGLARVTGFDFARMGSLRTDTVSDAIIDDLDVNYQSPECFKDPAKASIASDLFAAGVVFFELITGNLPFTGIEQMLEIDARFPQPASSFKQDLPQGFDDWLQTFCAFDPESRYMSAAVALRLLEQLLLPEAKIGELPAVEVVAMAEIVNFNELPLDFILDNRFRIQKKLGAGSFSVVYKVFEVMGDVVRVIKLVIKDRRSVYERLCREYKTLVALPAHSHVVKVIWAGCLNDKEQTPYIVFEYVEGLDVSELVDACALSLEDCVRLIRETALGLKHLHQHGVYHQDVKPSNLLWTDNGVCIIDFNVSVTENNALKGCGGTRRYVPPDFDCNLEPIASDLIDRDLYALGVCFYECLTSCYPFDEPNPPLKIQAKDPRQFKGCADLSSSLVNLIFKMLSPERQQRFSSADELLTALSEIRHFRSVLSTGEINAGVKTLEKLEFVSERPNSNPYVSHLLTLYSQSQVSNAGTRGLDAIGKMTYITTYLDDKLKPALLKGEFRLVIISGNAGDGKTAFIQQFEASARARGAQFQQGANGAVFQLKGQRFQSNYDGSQDEGEEDNNSVLQKFFAPFAGEDVNQWTQHETRLIAINEGRLVDFILEYKLQFPLLAETIRQGLGGFSELNGVLVINLNLRAVVAKQPGQTSIFTRLIQQMTRSDYWQACEQCDLKKKCYIQHNVKTFQDDVAGLKVIERLELLYTITHLRGRLHLTLRDLRSALAFMLVGIVDCDAIHRLYQQGGEENQLRILDGLYFNAWLGGSFGSNDRLISLLREIDVAEVSNPALDRELGFLSPDSKTLSRFGFVERSSYAEELLGLLFRNLPRDFSSKNRAQLISKHRSYVAHMRRRHYFECRDSNWQTLLPYRSIDSFMNAITQSGQNGEHSVKLLLQAINRGEGLNDPIGLKDKLALRVRRVDKGTIQSFRLFDGTHFSLQNSGESQIQSFLETMPQTLMLVYDSGDGHRASLRINLDIYEMLLRLNKGYRPSIEEEQGFYLSLSVFKNVLGSAPYQQVLLTANGFEFFQIQRSDQGVLQLSKMELSHE